MRRRAVRPVAGRIQILRHEDLVRTRNPRDGEVAGASPGAKDAERSVPQSLEWGETPIRANSKTGEVPGSDVTRPEEENEEVPVAT